MKRNPNDLTLRNLRAAKKTIVLLKRRIAQIETHLRRQHEWNKRVYVRIAEQTRWNKNMAVLWKQNRVAK